MHLGAAVVSGINMMVETQIEDPAALVRATQALFNLARQARRARESGADARRRQAISSPTVQEHLRSLSVAECEAAAPWEWPRLKGERATDMSTIARQHNGRNEDVVM